MESMTNGEWVAVALGFAVLIFLIRNRKSVKKAITSGSFRGGGGLDNKPQKK